MVINIFAWERNEIEASSLLANLAVATTRETVWNCNCGSVYLRGLYQVNVLNWRLTVWLLRRLEMEAIFLVCFPNFLISLLSLSHAVVPLSFPLPRSPSVLLFAAVPWRQVPGAAEQQPPDPSGDQGRRGRVPLRGQRRGPRGDRFCGHCRGRQRWVTFWRFATRQCLKRDTPCISKKKCFILSQT